jgi:hypothetical protein
MKLGRSARAVVCRAAKISLGPMGRGTITLNQFAEKSGYSRSRILSAAKLLKIRLRYIPRSDLRWTRVKHRWYAIGHEEQKRILAFLATVPDGQKLIVSRQGEWGGYAHRGGMKPAACIDCGTNKRPHFCSGRCSR